MEQIVTVHKKSMEAARLLPTSARSPRKAHSIRPRTPVAHSICPRTPPPSVFQVRGASARYPATLDRPLTIQTLPCLRWATRV